MGKGGGGSGGEKEGNSKVGGKEREGWKKDLPGGAWSRG